MSEQPQTQMEKATSTGHMETASGASAPTTDGTGPAEASGPPALAETRPRTHPRPGLLLHNHFVYPQGPLGMAQTMMTMMVIALFILTFLAQPYRIPSGSMENTLLVGDFLMVNKVVYATPGVWRFLLPYRNIQRDDVIVFHYPLDPSMHLVKRVIGLPQDSVRLQAGSVLVDGRPLNEPYAIHGQGPSSAFRDDFPSRFYTDPGINTHWWSEMQRNIQDGGLVVPANKYFVLGDNRNDSLDSRYWGFVPQQNIVGQPFLVYFSLSSADTSEITGPSDDRLTHKHDWRTQLAGVARWDRMFHIIH